MEPDHIEAQELGALCGESEAIVAQQQRSRQKAWMKRSAESDTKNWRPVKRRRVAAYTWMRALDGQLEWATGSGLAQFALEPGSDEASWGDLLKLPRLVVSPDQGSDIVAAANYMLGPLTMNVMFAWDPSHSVHNDCELGLSQSGLWVFMLCFIVIANVPCAPWGENERWMQCKAIMREASHGRPQDCPLFMSMLAELTDELGDDGIFDMDEPEAAIWQKVFDGAPWEWKAEKLKVSRFLGMIQRAKEEVRKSARRHFQYVLAGIETDVLHGGQFRKVHLSSITEPGTVGQPTSSARVSAEEKTLRASTQNTLAIAAMFWSDTAKLHRLKLIVAISTSALEWHQEQNTMLRDKNMTSIWAMGQLDHGFLRNLEACFNTMRQQDELTQMGCELPSDARGWQLSHGNTGLPYELGIANTMGVFAICLVGSRLKRMLWLVRGWPGMSARLLDPNVELRSQARSALARDLAAFEFCKNGEQPAALRDIVRRNCLNEVANKQLVSLFKQFPEDSNKFASFKTWLEESWNFILGSQVVEDSFQRCRAIMDKQTNMRAQTKRIFNGLISSTVLTGSHRQLQVDPNARCEHQRHGGEQPPDFSVKLRAPSIDTMPKIVGTSDSVGWYIPSVSSLPQKFSDLELLRGLQSDGLDKMKLRDLWLGSISRGQHRLLLRPRRRPGMPAGRWFFAMQEVPNSMVLVWPAEVVMAGATFQYRPAPENTFDIHDCFLCVMDLYDIEAAGGHGWADRSSRKAIQEGPECFPSQSGLRSSIPLRLSLIPLPPPIPNRRPAFK